MHKLLASAAVAATMMAAPAAAATMTGTVATTFIGVESSTPSIGAGSVLSAVDGGITVGSTGDFTGLGMQGFAPSSFTATNGSVFSFTSAWGNFLGTVSNVVVTGPESNRAITAFALGDFTPAGIYGTFDQGPASLTFSFTQNNSGGAIQGGFTLSTPPSPPPPAVPEPASWAMLIAGFGLTGAAMRRRRATKVAA